MKVINSKRMKAKKHSIIASYYKKLFKKKYGKMCKVNAYGAYYAANLKNSSYMIDFRFKGLPNVLFGIWKRYDDNNQPYYDYFAEHDAFIDKFKPTRVSIIFDDLDEMVSFANKISSSEEVFYAEMARLYLCDSIDEIKADIAECSQYKINGLKSDEIAEANRFIVNLSKEHPHMTFVLRKASTFRDLYDVLMYNGKSDEEYQEVYDILFDKHFCMDVVYPSKRDLRMHDKQYKYLKNGEFF